MVDFYRSTHITTIASGRIPQTVPGSLHPNMARLIYLQNLVLLLLLTLLGSGCATITRGTTDTLVVESDPAGADVRLSNGITGKTPTSFKLSRKESLTVDIRKDGYEPLSVRVTPQISGGGAAGMAGNVLVGGLVGVVVDPLSGAMNDLRPNPIQVRLVPLGAQTPKIQVPAEAPTPAAAPVSRVSLKSKLEELDAAFNSKLISETEYKAKRQALLDSM